MFVNSENPGGGERFLGISAMATTGANTNNGDILMLEAPPSERPAWLIGAEVIDALPYIDDDYGDPNVAKEVDRLVEEEMRLSSKKPADFLEDLPPLPKFNFEVSTKSDSFFFSFLVFMFNLISTSLL